MVLGGHPPGHLPGELPRAKDGARGSPTRALARRTAAGKGWCSGVTHPGTYPANSRTGATCCLGYGVFARAGRSRPSAGTARSLFQRLGHPADPRLARLTRRRRPQHESRLAAESPECPQSPNQPLFCNIVLPDTVPRPRPPSGRVARGHYSVCPHAPRRGMLPDMSRISPTRGACGCSRDQSFKFWGAKACQNPADGLWFFPPGVAPARDGLGSADRNNKATLQLTPPCGTSKSYARDSTPRNVKLQSASQRGPIAGHRRRQPAMVRGRSLFVSVYDPREDIVTFRHGF